MGRNSKVDLRKVDCESSRLMELDQGNIQWA